MTNTQWKIPMLPLSPFSYLFGLSFFLIDFSNVCGMLQWRVDSSNQWNGAHHGGHGYGGYGYAAAQHQDVGVHAAAAVNGAS